MIRFAASPDFLNAYALTDTFDPNAMVDTGMQGRAMERITQTDMDARIREKELMGEAMVERADILGGAINSATPGIGERFGQQLPNILGGLVSKGFSGGGSSGPFGGQNPLDVVNLFGNEGSGLPGNDFYVSGGSIFPNPT